LHNHADQGARDGAPSEAVVVAVADGRLDGIVWRST
jgi:hypothetical protein